MEGKEQIEKLAATVKEDVAAKGAELKTELEGLIKQANEGSEEKRQELKSSIENLVNKVNEMDGATKESIDKLHAEVKKASDFAGERKSEALSDVITKSLNEESYKEFAAEPTGKSFGLEVMDRAETKVMTFGGIGGVNPNIDQSPSIIPAVSRNTRVRQLVNVGATDGNTFKFVQETAVDNATAANVAEGDQKQDTNYTLTNQDAPVRKIADSTQVTEEHLEDLAGMATFLSRRGIERLLDQEDSQLLTGNGTGANLTGIGASPTAFANITGNSFGTGTAQKWDVLVNAAGQVGGLNYMANGALVHPHDFAGMLLTKDTTNDYVSPFVWNAAGQAFIYNLPIFVSTAQTAGTFTVGDWLMGAEVLQRTGISANFYNQDRDNVVKNLVTVVIEERLAFPIYYPKAFVQQTFSSAITVLET